MTDEEILQIARDNAIYDSCGDLRVSFNGNLVDFARSIERKVQEETDPRKRWIEYNGRRMHLGAWARELGISDCTLLDRIRKYPLDVAMTAKRLKSGPPIGSKYPNRRTRRGQDNSKYKHGMTKTPEYRVWAGMIQRCENPSPEDYPLYQGKGITVCKEWRGSFEQFYRDMGPRPSPKHSIDRIDGDGNYELGNCRWATTVEQRRNTSTVHWIEFDGRRMCLEDWAQELGINPATLSDRFQRGWPVERALTPKKFTGGAAKGYKHSVEFCEKQRIAAYARWEKRREKAA